MSAVPVDYRVYNKNATLSRKYLGLRYNFKENVKERFGGITSTGVAFDDHIMIYLIIQSIVGAK